MPRHPRIVLPGRPHHVTQRGNNGREVFFSDADREIYLSLLKGYAADYSVDVLGFCLMTNHVHLIAVPNTGTGLAKALGQTHNDYSRWLHIRRRESGHLWQNRYFSCPLDNAHTWAALAYIERNPVAAALVPRAEDWPWSSARYHLGLADVPAWLDVNLWSQNWGPGLWRSAIDKGLGEAGIRVRLQEATRIGRPLGNDEFVTNCETQSGLHLRKRKPGPKPKHALSQPANRSFDYDAA
jgi:putative transposase